jgi:hypothetical protein
MQGLVVGMRLLNSFFKCSRENVELGEYFAEKCLELEPNNSGSQTLLNSFHSILK